MLITVTVMPILFAMLEDVPPEAPPDAAPATAGVTLLVTVALAVRARGMLRLWVPFAGLLAGCAAAGWYGIYDTARVAEADWFGLPAGGWPGLDLDFGTRFWSLLPAFAFVTIVGAIETTGDAVAIQQVSWRTPKAADYRAVQGAIAADGVGNLLSGLAGTVPNTTYSTSASMAELTGVAARSVGIWIGAAFVVAAFSPKLVAVLLAVPSPVAAAYIAALLSLLFVLGMRMVVQNGIDYRRALVAGIAFWIGVGFQNQLVFADRLGPSLSTLLGNGMTSGALAAIAMTAFLELAKPRRQILHLPDDSALARLLEFLASFASRHGLSEGAALRLAAIGEETLHSLRAVGRPRQLRVSARRDGRDVELEFLAAPMQGNIEDQIVLLGSRATPSAGSELPLRLLRHYAEEVRHQKYFDTDVVSVRMSASRPAEKPSRARE